jgi:hypothetical protein
MCRMRRFLVVLKSFFHSYLLYPFSCHSSSPPILPSSLTSPCHLFLGLPLVLVYSKFIYNTFWRILFSSILCPCPNQHNLCSFIVCVMAMFFNIWKIYLSVNILQFSFSFSYTGPRILPYTSLLKMLYCFLSVFVNVEVSDAYVKLYEFRRI